MYTVEVRGVDSLLKQLTEIPNGINRAMARAINRTSVTGRFRITQAITEKTNLKAGSVKEVITQTKATAKNPVGKLTITDTRRPIYDFKGIRQTKKGVSVQTYPGGKRYTIPGSFTSEVYSAKQKARGIGHKGAFIRKRGYSHGYAVQGKRKAYHVRGGLTPSGRTWRLPIREIYGPSVTGLFVGVKDLADSIIRDLDDVLLKNLQHEVQYLLRGK